MYSFTDVYLPNSLATSSSCCCYSRRNSMFVRAVAAATQILPVTGNVIDLLRVCASDNNGIVTRQTT